ncbi:hypothetical protein [Flavobacterium sp. HSC-61S13]|uniref:hypothetical protein n=1 Tax=Flavobacterium sp. HSC-61S13 TaxID=2910963 RepID=UPI00209E1B29|nr:hypothetical protein [Flavobacterium sp. HSC-61S13]MCP1994665.1 hypothetical protein [Flavobacterium sp. HSC-61S13]
MKIIYDNQNNQIEIQDDMKSLLRAQRIVVTVVLVASFTKLYFINWQSINTYDYLFVVIFGVFVYFFIKNFFFKTSQSIINLSDIKYLKKAKGVRSKAYLRLKNGKIREFSNITTRDEKIDIPEKFRKAGVAIKI